MKRRFGSWLLIAMMLISALSFAGVSAKASPCLNLKSVVIKKGQTVSLKVKNNKKKVKWSSANKKIATVKKGKVTGKKAGNTTIKAKVGKKTYTCKVTVSDGKKKSLVVVFSHSGTTKAVAKTVAEAAGADLLELYEKKAYTKNYNKMLNIAESEQNKDARPAIATKIKNFKQYDTVYVGYPIWWGKEPMVIRTFLEQYSWTGKTIIPFCTSGGSGISGSISGIKKCAKNAKVKSGKDLSDMSKSEITSWVKSVSKNSNSAKESKTDSSNSKQDDASKNDTSKNDASTTTQVQPSTNPKEDATGDATKVDGTNILVVYFSCTGNTKPLAQYAAEYLNADIFEIEAAVPYTDADIAYYTNCRADQEQNDSTARPAIANTVSNMEQYDTIVLGYPIWHGQAPRIIDTFMESYDFSGKTIVPFCTSASSGIGNSDTALHDLVGSDVTWKAGQRFAIGTKKDVMTKWLEDLAITPYVNVGK